jgi:hypothetical protein
MTLQTLLPPAMKLGGKDTNEREIMAKEGFISRCDSRILAQFARITLDTAALCSPVTL